MARNDLTAAQLREFIHYDPQTGVFVWIKNPYRTAIAGSIAGGQKLTCSGYHRIRIDGFCHMAHRLAWLYMTGFFPAHQIDHINGIRTDNRFCNLRSVDQFTNMQNLRRAMNSNKSSGLLGVTWNKALRKWQSAITVDRKTKYIGLFYSPEEAHQAYVEKKREVHPGCTI